jgi:uncharacterized membrane protein YoaK (UPF0700 family)
VLQACVLAIIAGYADAVGYLRYEAFAGLMTGNTILMGIELVSGNLQPAAFHGVIIAVFLAGVIASRVLLRFGLPAWSALTIAAVLLALCSVAAKDWAALLLALAMGMQNSAANRFNGVSLNTVFITGNLQKLGEGLLAWLWPPRDASTAPSDGVAIFALVWLTYAIGAAVGAAGSRFLSHPLLVPAVILPLALFPRRSVLRAGAVRQ